MNVVHIMKGKLTFVNNLEHRYHNFLWILPLKELAFGSCFRNNTIKLLT